MSLFDLTQQEYREIDARLTAHYGLTKDSSPNDVLSAVQRSVKNARQVAAEIGVSFPKLTAFHAEWLRRVMR